MASQAAVDQYMAWLNSRKNMAATTTAPYQPSPPTLGSAGLSGLGGPLVTPASAAPMAAMPAYAPAGPGQPQMLSSNTPPMQQQQSQAAEGIKSATPGLSNLGSAYASAPYYGAGAVGTGSTATMAGGSLGMTGYGASGAASGMGGFAGFGATGAGGAAAGAAPAAGGAGGGLAAAGPAAGFAALIGGGKLLEERNSASPVGRGLLSGLGPSISQMKADPKLAATTAVGIPFINGWIRNKKAAEAKPEWAGFMGMG